MKPRDQMTIEEFAAEKRVPHGMTAADVANCPETLAAWRRAVVAHYYAGDGSHRCINERLARRPLLEAAYAALVSASRAARQTAAS